MLAVHDAEDRWSGGWRNIGAGGIGPGEMVGGGPSVKVVLHAAAVAVGRIAGDPKLADSVELLPVGARDTDDEITDSGVARVAFVAKAMGAGLVPLAVPIMHGATVGLGTRPYGVVLKKIILDKVAVSRR